jgi:hypothetical protein
MGENAEIVHVDIPLDAYEKNITGLIEALLTIDDNLFPPESRNSGQEVA